jgi:hypothetical protein
MPRGFHSMMGGGGVPFDPVRHRAAQPPRRPRLLRRPSPGALPAPVPPPSADGGAPLRGAVHCAEAAGSLPASAAPGDSTSPSSSISADSARRAAGAESPRRLLEERAGSGLPLSRF